MIATVVWLQVISNSNSTEINRVGLGTRTCVLTYIDTYIQDRFWEFPKLSLLEPLKLIRCFAFALGMPYRGSPNTYITYIIAEKHLSLQLICQDRL